MLNIYVGSIWYISHSQEPIKRSLYLSYVALESTLSRVGLIIEGIPREVSHAHLLLGPSAGGDPPFIGAKCRWGPTFYWSQVQEGAYLLLGLSTGGHPPFIGAKYRRAPTFYWGQVQDPPFIGAKYRRAPTFYWGQVQEGTHLLLGPSAGGDPPFIGAKYRREPPFIGVWQPLR